MLQFPGRERCFTLNLSCNEIFKFELVLFLPEVWLEMLLRLKKGGFYYSGG